VRTRPSKTYLKTNSIYTCLPSIRYDTIRAIITGDSQDRYILYVTFQFLLVCVSNQRCPINCLHLIITLRHSANQVDGRHNYSSRKAKAGYVDDIRRWHATLYRFTTADRHKSLENDALVLFDQQGSSIDSAAVYSQRYTPPTNSICLHSPRSRLL